MSFWHSHKKTTSGISLLLAVAMFGSLFFMPKPVKAQGLEVPVADWISRTELGVILENTTLLQIKENVLDMIITIAAKVLIRALGNSLLNWINSGFSGSPSFAQDPSGFFKGVIDDVAGFTIGGLGLNWLCDIQGLDLRANLQLTLGIKYMSGYGQSHPACTPAQISQNVTDLMSGGVMAGGWDGWIEMTSESKNNFYGSYMDSQFQIDAAASVALSSESQKLDWGSGFFSNEISGFLNDVIATPGAIIKDQLNQVLGSDQAALIVADEIGELVSAITGALMNQAISAGLGAVAGGGNQAPFSPPNTISPEQQNAVGLTPGATTPGGIGFEVPVANQPTSGLGNPCATTDCHAAGSGGGSGGAQPPLVQMGSFSGALLQQSSIWTSSENIPYGPGNAVDGTAITQAIGIGWSWWQVDLPQEESNLNRIEVEIAGYSFAANSFLYYCTELQASGAGAVGHNGCTAVPMAGKTANIIIPLPAGQTIKRIHIVGQMDSYFRLYEVRLVRNI